MFRATGPTLPKRCQTQALPPLEFAYTRFVPEGRKFSRVQGADLPTRFLANRGLELVDLFGNRLPDFLEMNGTVRYWRSMGDSRFDRPRDMRVAPAGVHLADPGVQLLDADGDGRTDSTCSLASFFPQKVHFV